MCLVGFAGSSFLISPVRKLMAQLVQFHGLRQGHMGESESVVASRLRVFFGFRRASSMAFSGGVKLGDLDDFISLSQALQRFAWENDCMLCLVVSCDFVKPKETKSR